MHVAPMRSFTAGGESLTELRMTEVAVAALDPRLQKQVESARTAFERGNDALVVELCIDVLAAAPGCLPVRKLHRAAQLRLAGAKRGALALAFGKLSTAPFLIGGSVQLERDPLRAIASAQRMLEADPHSRAGLQLLGRAASAQGWRETAVFACEAWRDIAPHEVDAHVALGRAQLEAGRAAAAVPCAEAALRLDPLHGAAQALLKDASVGVSLREGNWEARGDFRGKLRS